MIPQNTLTGHSADYMADPLPALVPGSVLAVLTGVEGPHYRRPGTVMAFLPDGRRVGQLSSGCIEADIAIHAGRLAPGDAPLSLRYGQGSPFRDLILPCGGGIDVALVPVGDVAPVKDALARQASRQTGHLGIDLKTGAMAAGGPGFAVPLPPNLRFAVAGTGIEPVRFAALARASGFDAVLHSHDETTQAAGAAAGVGATGTEALDADPWTAVALFYHEHDLELPLLVRALAGRAFWIGAQGSKRAHETRVAALTEAGVGPDAIERLRSPIGVIPSARDPAVLAVSVLAEIVGEYAGRAATP
ncbi:XdhC family protein [Paracoccus sp. TK19116]|uniref:XdhC family protein n=1 Tax=Paracoccus albicereus TaxID=2922394 RepID=A0ABT1MU98_9RHOB|nr:XdhC family protein [Paracoccus albicereus]MCQ0971910.1 XdhC family protein [Paracoccus albicereus]